MTCYSRRMPKLWKTSSLIISFALALCACSRDTIPNTDVEDTRSNREVIDFVEVYRKAMEKRDVAKLLSMVSPIYFDDNGTPSAADDLDYNRLKKELESLRDKTLEVRYEIRYRQVSFRPPQIWVEYTYTGRFRIMTPDGERWVRKLADNRLVLVRKGDSFQVLSGM